MSPNGTPVPPRNLHRGDRVTIVLWAGGRRITGKVRSNDKGWICLEDVNSEIYNPHRYPHTAIRHAIKY